MICISFIAKGVEHFHMYLLAIFIFPFENCLFNHLLIGLFIQFSEENLTIIENALKGGMKVCLIPSHYTSSEPVTGLEPLFCTDSFSPPTTL
jgi:hypothetical protein